MRISGQFPLPRAMSSWWRFILLVLGFCLPGTRSREIQVVHPGGGLTTNNILFMERVPKIQGYPHPDDPPFRVESNVPVSILRHTDSSYLLGGEPLRPDEIYLVVKSNCAQTSETDISIDVSFDDYPSVQEWDQNNYTGSIIIMVSNPQISNETQETDPEVFLEATSFRSLFGITTDCFWSESRSVWQPFGWATILTMVITTTFLGTVTSLGQSSSASKGNGSWGMLYFVALLGLVVGLVLAQEDAPVLTNEVSRATLDGGDGVCIPTFNVELLIDGCRRSDFWEQQDLTVLAPALRILDVDYQEVSATRPPDQRCRTEYEGLLQFPSDSLASPSIANQTGVATQRSANEPIPVFSGNPADDFQCQGRPVDGRPFVDVHGLAIMAQAAVAERGHEQSWSRPHIVTPSISSPIPVNEILANEWTQRALGEHASIAAFAAFTIDLLSNGAPPDLIEDALAAGLDEVRHARISFEIAALFHKGHTSIFSASVEPGPLAHSKHSFGHDLESLAYAAAKEGCVDETLSALVAAFQVDNLDLGSEGLDDSTKQWLRAQIRSIALDEARHSALAWRTVRWACQADTSLCSSTQDIVFQTQSLQHAFWKRFGSFPQDNSRTLDAWRQVYTSLIPFAIGHDTATTDCASRVLQNDDDSISFLDELVDSIINETKCVKAMH